VSQCHDIYCLDHYNGGSRHRVDGDQCHDFYESVTEDAQSEGQDRAQEDLDVMESAAAGGELQPV
jgi:hypothetical protein